MTRQEAMRLVESEVVRAGILHPEWPKDRIHAAGIVCEEAGECMQAALDNHYANKRKSHIAEEAIHTAATAIRLLENL